jgi:hypothetical protein
MESKSIGSRSLVASNSHFATSSFLRLEVANPMPNPQAGWPPLVGCPRLLIQYIITTLHIWRPVSSIRVISWWQGQISHVLGFKETGNLWNTRLLKARQKKNENLLSLFKIVLVRKRFECNGTWINVTSIANYYKRLFHVTSRFHVIGLTSLCILPRQCQL